MDLLLSDTVVLFALVLAAFVAGTTFTLALTTPVDTPAKRLARYARHTARRSASGATEPEEPSLRERVLAPLGASISALVARTAPRRQHEAVAAELTMAGSTVSPTAFLAVRLAMTFGVPALAILYVLTK